MYLAPFIENGSTEELVLIWMNFSTLAGISSRFWPRDCSCGNGKINISENGGRGTSKISLFYISYLVFHLLHMLFLPKLFFFLNIQLAMVMLLILFVVSLLLFHVCLNKYKEVTCFVFEFFPKDYLLFQYLYALVSADAFL